MGLLCWNRLLRKGSANVKRNCGATPYTARQRRPVVRDPSPADECILRGSDGCLLIWTRSTSRETMLHALSAATKTLVVNRGALGGAERKRYRMPALMRIMSFSQDVAGAVVPKPSSTLRGASRRPESNLTSYVGTGALSYHFYGSFPLSGTLPRHLCRTACEPDRRAKCPRPAPTDRPQEAHPKGGVAKSRLLPSPVPLRSAFPFNR